MSSAVPRMLKPLQPFGADDAGERSSERGETRAHGRLWRPLIGGTLGWLAGLVVLAAAADPTWVETWLGW